MLWLAYVAPVVALVVYALTGLRTRHEARRDRELSRWRAMMRPAREVERRPEGYRKLREEPADLGGPRSVATLPGDLHRMLSEIGGGTPVGYYELVYKLAYVAVMGPDAVSGSEYQAVVARLEAPGPALTARPLPILEGKRVPNTGVHFKKDPGFMQLFLVEGQNGKAIGKWLTRRVRKALLELPEAWLYVRGRTMALVVYGPVDAERLEELVVVADEIFADYGDEGGPSLLDEDDEGDAGAAPDDADDEEDEEKAAPPPKAKPAKGAGKVAAKGTKAEGKPAARKA